MHVFEESGACISPGSVKANLEAVRRFVATRNDVSDVSFCRAICELQSPEVTVAPVHGRPLLIWDRYEAAGVSAALCDSMAVETLPPDCAYTDAERRLCRPVVRDGLRQFRRCFPESFAVFCETIPFVLLAKRDGHHGGSVSRRIGFVWLAPSSDWTAQECGERLWHEYLHHALFLEDMVNTVFVRDPCAMSEPENRVPSAVRGVARRYDQSYHSAWVASGLIEYRARLSDIDGARAVFPRLWPCLDALAAKREVLTDNGAQLDRLIDAVFYQAEKLAVLDPPAPTLR